MFLFDRTATMPRPAALKGRSEPIVTPAASLRERRVAGRAVARRDADGRLRTRLLLGRREEVLADARRHLDGRRLRRRLHPNPPTRRSARAAPVTPRSCLSRTTRRASRTSSCSRSSGRTTTRRRACGRAMTPERSTDLGHRSPHPKERRTAEASTRRIPGRAEEGRLRVEITTEIRRPRRGTVLLRGGLPPAIPRRPKTRAATARTSRPASRARPGWASRPRGNSRSRSSPERGKAPVIHRGLCPPSGRGPRRSECPRRHQRLPVGTSRPGTAPIRSALRSRPCAVHPDPVCNGCAVAVRSESTTAAASGRPCRRPQESTCANGLQRRPLRSGVGGTGVDFARLRHFGLLGRDEIPGIVPRPHPQPVRAPDTGFVVIATPTHLTVRGPVVGEAVEEDQRAAHGAGVLVGRQVAAALGKSPDQGQTVKSVTAGT